MNYLILARNITLMGYLGIGCLLIMWYGWLAPSSALPAWLVLGMLLTPMLFPLQGLVTGRPYTYAWSAFLSLFYFTHGITEAFSMPQERLYGLFEVALSILWFTGAILFVRLSKRRNGASGES